MQSFLLPAPNVTFMLIYCLDLKFRKSTYDSNISVLNGSNDTQKKHQIIFGKKNPPKLSFNLPSLDQNTNNFTMEMEKQHTKI